MNRATTVDLTSLRLAGGVMLAVAAVRPLVPGTPGVPCPLRLATGIPCPLCGMTTSVTAAAHLDLGEAAAANPAGILAVAVAVVLLLARRPTRLDLPKWAVPAAFAAMWAFQLQRFSIV
ncbi:MAG TPA: DUF2752 domain-containing protein [Acidimicrobiales bacterium]|nr:DUF2752 domain-containing protein [Acidimicrobiales bacterium]